MSESELILRYPRPATQWVEALPVGNGRLGAMVFGGITSERLQLNEDTLWSGAPSEWNNPEARIALPEVRRLVAEGRYEEADRASKRMQGPFNQSYLPLGDLRLVYDGDGTVDSYERSLDLDSALAGVVYTSSGARYTREVFASAPQQAIIVRLDCDQPGRMTFTAAIDSPLRFSVAAISAETLELTGRCPRHVAQVFGRMAVMPRNGHCRD